MKQQRICKYFFYRNIKPEFGLEKYVSQLPDVYVISLMKFRCSNHKLSIELGRRQGVPRENRLCDKCDMGTLGDEFHLIFECPHYQLLRQQLIPRKFLSNI